MHGSAEKMLKVPSNSTRVTCLDDGGMHVPAHFGSPVHYIAYDAEITT